MTAILNSHLQKAEKIRADMARCSQKGIQILPPDVNKSSIEFSVENGAIRFGLKGLKNVGASSVQIIEQRETKGEFSDYVDIVKRLSVNKSVFESLIYSGALDVFEGTRQAKLDALSQMVELAKREKERQTTGRISLLNWILENQTKDIQDLHDFFRITVRDVEEMDKQLKLEKEYEIAGCYITEHPIDRFFHVLAKANTQPISLLLVDSDDDDENEGTVFKEMTKTTVEDSSNDLIDSSEKQLVDGDVVTIAGVVKEFELKHTKKDNSAFGVFKLEDRSGIIKVVCFSKEYRRYQEAIKNGKIVKLIGRFKKTDFGVEVHAMRVEDLELKEGANKLTRIDVRSCEDLGMARQQYLNLLSLAKVSVGDIPVFFHNQIDGMIYELPVKISPVNMIMEQIQSIFGNENIIYS